MALIAAVVGVAVVIAVAAFVIFANMPVLHTGDYVEYKVFGTDINGNPIYGHMNMSVTSAGWNGCDIRYEYPGLGISAVTKHFDGLVGLAGPFGLGNKTQSNTVLWTDFGNKKVDIYTMVEQGWNVTAYVGSNPSALYKLEMRYGTATMNFFIEQTNLHSVMTGNAA